MIRKTLLIGGAMCLIALFALTMTGVIASGHPTRNAPRDLRPRNVDGLRNVWLPLKTFPVERRALIDNAMPEIGEQDLEYFHDLGELASRIEDAPRHRQDHFAWLQNANVYLHGYSAMVLDSKSTTHGYVVKLRVRPQITAGRNRGGTSATSLDCICEWYELSHGKWRYLRGEDDPGADQAIFTD
jgi:hypothetical protein